MPVQIDDQQPSTSAAAFEALKRAHPGEDIIQMIELETSVNNAVGHRDQTYVDNCNYLNDGRGRLSKRITYFIFFSTIILPIFKVIACLSVVSVDVNKDHQCRINECHHLVYTQDAAVYFIASLLFLILSVAQIFIGLEMFIRFPDIRCLIVVTNVLAIVTPKDLDRPMKLYTAITGFEIFVVVLTSIISHPNALIMFPCLLVIGTELVAFLTVVCHPTSSAYVALREASLNNRG